MKKIIRTTLYIMLLMMMVISLIDNSASILADDVIPEFLLSDYPIVVEQGSDISNYLHFDGFFISQSDIDVEETGEYSITYQKITTAEEFKKDVYVIEKELNKYSRSLVAHTIKSSGNTNIIYVLAKSFGSNGYGVVYYANTSDQVPGLNSIFLRYVDTKTGEVAEPLVRYRAKVEITDMLLDGDKIILVGVAANVLNGNKDVFLYTYNIKTKASQVYNYGGSLDENVTSVTQDSLYYYLAGSTKSNDGPFNSVPKDHDSMIIKISKADYAITKAIVINKTGDDYIDHLTYSNGYLYAVFQNEQSKINMIKFDVFLNVLVQKDYSYVNDVSYSDFYNNCDLPQITIRSYNYQKGCYEEEIMWVNEDLTLTRYHLFDDADGATLVDYVCDDKMMFCMFKNENVVIYKLYQNNELSFQQIDYFNGFEPAIIGDLKGTVLIGYNNNEIGFFRHLYLLIQETSGLEIKGIDEVQAPCDYQIIMNGEYVEHDKMSELTVGKTFGQYQVKYIFQHSFIYTYVRTINVTPYFSVIEGGNHDVGLVIRFNGIGWLNGDRVDSGYQINDTGYYTLRIEGLDGQTAEAVFTVSKISVEDQEIIEQEKVDVTFIETEESVLAEVNFIDQNISYEPPSDLNWYYMMPFSSLIISVLIFILRKE